METDCLNETIRVGAVFETTGKLRPAVILYKGRRIKVNRINYKWDSGGAGYNFWGNVDVGSYGGEFFNDRS